MRLPIATLSHYYLVERHTHITSPMLMTSLEASGPASSECASTSPMLSTEWSLGPSSSSWASSSPSPPTLYSPAPPPVVPTTWWSSSPHLCLRPLLPLPPHLRPSRQPPPLPLS
ncbi:hypothetical protein B296_00031038 [Ensete ventricosum]|uniref:Uncharacterized protein n=1 Tax=Ensete ventricosum TaxID=4639 RepID=A0A426XIA0_ENSVE|nr:hypothetical protein B296_00031038 [Ensete ventricosum]